MEKVNEQKQFQQDGLTVQLKLVGRKSRNLIRRYNTTKYGGGIPPKCEKHGDLQATLLCIHSYQS